MHTFIGCDWRNSTLTNENITRAFFYGRRCARDHQQKRIWGRSWLFQEIGTWKGRDEIVLRSFKGSQSLSSHALVKGFAIISYFELVLPRLCKNACSHKIQREILECQFSFSCSGSRVPGKATFSKQASLSMLEDECFGSFCFNLQVTIWQPNWYRHGFVSQLIATNCQPSLNYWKWICFRSIACCTSSWHLRTFMSRCPP